MEIKEIPNRKLKNLKPVAMNCDHKLGAGIPPPFPSLTSFVVFCGPPRSGKTSLMVSLLTSRHPKVYRKIFDNIFLIAPESSMNSLKKNPFRDLAPEHVFHELNREILEDIADECAGLAEQEENNLLIIDDFAADLKRNDLQRQLARLIQNRRHLHLTIWLLTQNYTSIPLSPLRKLINFLIMFKPTSIVERDSVFEELVITVPKKDIVHVSRYIWDDPHDTLDIDIYTGNVYKNFNLIQFHKEEEEHES